MKKSLEDFLHYLHGAIFAWNEENYSDVIKKLKQYSIYDNFAWVIDYINEFKKTKSNLENCSSSHDFWRINKEFIKFIKSIKNNDNYSLNSKKKVLELLSKIGYDYLKMEALFLQYDEVRKSTLIYECDNKVLLELFNKDIKKFINSDKYYMGLNELDKVLKLKNKRTYKFLDEDVLVALSICSYLELARLKANNKLWDYRVSTYVDKDNTRNYKKFLFRNFSLLEDKELMCIVDNRFSLIEYSYIDGEVLWLFNRIYDDEFLVNNGFLDVKYDKQVLFNDFLKKIRGIFDDLKSNIDVPCRHYEMEANFKKIVEYLDLVKRSDIFVNEDYVDFIYYIYNISFQYMKLEFKFFDNSIIYDYFVSNLHDYNYVGELVKSEIESIRTSVNCIEGMDKLVYLIESNECIDNMDKKLVKCLSSCNF